MPKGKLLDPSRGIRVRLRTSKTQEKKTASRMGGRNQPGSGARWNAKGDTRTKQWLIENKTTAKSQYTLKLAELRKIILEAVRDGRHPALEVDFGKDLTVVVLPLAVAQELGYDDSTE